MTKTIDVEQAQLIIGARQITGFIKGESISYSIPQGRSVATDAHGNSVIIKNYDKTIVLTLRLFVGSESNDYLSDLANLGVLADLPATFRDFSSNTAISCAQSFVNFEDNPLTSDVEMTITWTLTMLNAAISRRGIINR